jgi:hypothetical protein
MLKRDLGIAISLVNKEHNHPTIPTSGIYFRIHNDNSENVKY